MVSFALLAAALAAVLAAEGTPLPPDAIYKRAAIDHGTVSPNRQKVTRYLSLNAYAPEVRWQVVQSLDFTANSLSWRSNHTHPEIIGEDRLLYQVDLSALGWDRDSRIAQRAEWEKRGVTFKFKTKAEEERFLDPWEALAASDPYFKTSQVNNKGELVRGWIDPVVEERTRYASRSSNLVLRADWFLAYALVEKERGGFYSLLLMLPDNEKDLYKLLLLPIDAIERAPQLRFGGAVAKSIVAFHNRGLELFYSPYGRGSKYVWRTYDFLNDNVREKNIYESLAGTLKHDGRELIGSLPNGLQFYALYDGKGKQVAVVPQDIALDMRRDTLDRDRNVRNAVKCISCHEAGINPYEDRIGFSILHKDIRLATFSKDDARAAGRVYEIEDYYKIAEKGGLAREIVRHQESYAESVFDINNLTPEDNAKRTVGWYDAYVHKLVGLDQAAREMGTTVEGARAAMAASSVSGNSVLRVLRSGQEIGRSQWEASFGAAMRAQVYPWEKAINVGH